MARLSGRLTSSRSLWIAVFAVAFGTNVPTPLLLVYRDTLGLSATTLTGLFGVYALGLVPTLLLAGPASDRRGRRGVVIPFAILGAVASVVFLGASHSLPLLFVGRLLQGAVSGAVFSVGSAWMAELVPDAGQASRQTTAALGLGFGLGPLSSGMMAQWLPAPTTLPYLVHLVLMVVGIATLVGVPETATQRTRGRLLNLGIPPSARRAFLAYVVPVALCVFTFPSVSVAVLPLRLRADIPGFDVLIAGVVAGVTMGTGVIVQPLAARLGLARSGPLAAAAGAAGIALGVLSGVVSQPALLLPAALLLGTTYGLSLASGLTATQQLADPSSRGALVGTFYALTYVGFSAPVVLSVLAGSGTFDGPLWGLAGFGLVLVAVLVLGPGAALVGPHSARRSAVPGHARGPRR